MSAMIFLARELVFLFHQKCTATITNGAQATKRRAKPDRDDTCALSDLNPIYILLPAAQRSSSAAPNNAQRCEGMHAEGVHVGWSAGLGVILK